MELSRLSRKEIINLHDGARLGFVGDSDLIIDDETGSIKSIIISPKGMKPRSGRELVIPWTSIKKIGDEVMIVDISPERSSRKHT
ncbi:YlmC/YmxH family sporulation protein [Dethiobacter alkaliphilus]|uniref:Sporulation protein, YlmC/YmxH family n=1 Tax=Dethiobacter alkaliphilus AHT 1 TaxID=555088 RepID=C0GIX6_DETAL|nr:YlmC/YmxH family sporulation protein [Dethiobacter alkaliphilus]EEG76790.1 sporulation protein, YlmC/YmxH family [Dethiobacter alkaliphilus AHT 1]MCW3490825.1 YlmC/YmxH family sporulation protein [Dethiobacter alkaliphilus]